jgi:hypothetical protein
MEMEWVRIFLSIENRLGYRQGLLDNCGDIRLARDFLFCPPTTILSPEGPEAGWGFSIICSQAGTVQFHGKFLQKSHFISPRQGFSSLAS